MGGNDGVVSGNDGVGRRNDGVVNGNDGVVNEVFDDGWVSGTDDD